MPVGLVPNQGGAEIVASRWAEGFEEGPDPPGRVVEAACAGARGPLARFLGLDKESCRVGNERAVSLNLFV